jgi:hypothetical protein
VIGLRQDDQLREPGPDRVHDLDTEYRYTTSVYVVRVLNPARAQPGAQAITLDDRALEGERITR